MTQSALARIETRYDALSTALQKAARWATDHPADVCFLSLREQARRAGVVPPTMSRLAKALGFADFRAFQDNFRDCIAWGSGDFADRAQRMQRRARTGAAKAPPLGQLQASNVESNFPRPGDSSRIALFPIWWQMMQPFTLDTHSAWLSTP